MTGARPAERAAAGSLLGPACRSSWFGALYRGSVRTSRRRRTHPLSPFSEFRFRFVWGQYYKACNRIL
jgi:hypothetical protein